MKQLLFTLLCIFISLINTTAQNEPAYFEVNKSTQSMEAALEAATNTLTNSGFKILGKYNPGNSNDLAVLCYTNSELEKIALSFEDRGALAVTLKIGFKRNGEEVATSMINPMYLFYAYFTDNIDEQEDALRDISDSAKKAMLNIGSELKPFGGTLEKKKLQKYRYKVMMPYFKDAEKIKQFSSFEEGLKTIKTNLENSKGDTELVYELVYPNKNIAVFGVGLKNPETGESKFLSIIGDDHIAAMPYEIILQGNTASILPGRFRIALHWPELTMGTFMKIMSTPGDIKNTMKDLTE